MAQESELEGLDRASESRVEGCQLRGRAEARTRCQVPFFEPMEFGITSVKSIMFWLVSKWYPLRA